MDRSIFWYGSILRSLDLLNIGQETMVGAAELAKAILGTGVATVGLGAGVTPGGGLTVSVARGQIYQIEPLEATAISDLLANPTPILKQGINLAATTVSGFAAPTTVGDSINYLLECQYQDADTGSIVLNYYDADNPTGPPFSGPGNNGLPNTTIRQGIIAFQVLAGTAAPSGTQTTPATTSGWTALAVVTVAHAQTVIITANITAPAVPVPDVPITLPAIPAAIQTGEWVSWPDTGTTNALVVTPVPSLPNPLTTGTQIRVAVANDTTGSASMDVKNGQGPLPLHRNDGTTCQNLDLVVGMETVFTFDNTGNWQYVPSPNAWASGTPAVDQGSAWAFILGQIQ